jgi:large subunit ribosomal protein L6
MSRIGSKPVSIPSGVNVTLSGSDLTVKGAKGQLSMTCVKEVLVNHEGAEITFKPRDQSKRARSMWGMQRSLAQNLVTGVTDGYVRELEIQGVGYRAAVQDRMLRLQLGYSHDIEFAIPEGIDVECERPTMVKITGIDKQKVGQVAAEIRGFRPPEPYKGKGIRYVGEYVFRKEGKKK